jgi:hypothetical protein
MQWNRKGNIEAKKNMKDERNFNVTETKEKEKQTQW